MEGPDVISIDTADKYVNYVKEKVKADPARRSALRRSVGRPVDDVATRKAHAVVAPWLPTDRTRPAVESAYYSVAALIAVQPRLGSQGAITESEGLADGRSGEHAGTERQKRERPSSSLGGTLGQAVQDKRLNADSVESRLHLLCRQDVPGLHRMLPGLVRQLAVKDVEPDWGRLLKDLSRWEYGRDQVTKQWLQDFYRTINKPDQAEQNDDNPESEDL
ncbi:type I-E CRISPR-associated protein Cse2/CasB [Microtetraspora malaysiensis]|uniref:type I-E CRISPR-associated protein Cse2/CasB n=1 Tax=Microtetraspora malaysiensis TaxID=161358 RepID=UPI003D8C474C